MTNDARGRTAAFLGALREMSQELESELHVVSPEAQEEWRSLQAAWSSDGALGQDTKSLTEAQLEALVAKVRRFKDIVQAQERDDR